jgi:Ca2+:H+ antiporter
MKKLFSVYLLFAFIPITVALEYVKPELHTLIFFSAAMAIIPVARLISEATENISHYTGPSIGGLLNATFGNFPELVIMLIALKAGLHEMVLASLIGCVLANLLLALGVSFFVGGLKHHTQDFNPVSARIYSTMMFIAVISMVVPSSFGRVFGSQDVFREEAMLNIGLSVILLITYVLYLIFMIKTHPDFFTSSSSEEKQGHEEEPWSMSRAIISLLIASVLAAWMSEILVGSAEETGKALGMSTTFIGIIILAIVGGAAESLSAISMAKKNKMDLTLSIALGSCIQISLMLAPIAVLASYFIGPAPMNLSFRGVEMGVLFLSVLMGIMVASDGKSNWYKGIQLIVIYLIIAFMFYFMPE